MQRQYIAPLIIVLAVFALYGGFLYSPIVFDDNYFFLPGAPESFMANIGLYPRHMAYATLALTWKWLGPSLLAFRVQSMLLHAAVAIALYFFLRQIQRSMAYDSGKPSMLLPLLAALIFALHPAAIYGAAYLIERTIVMATLFALLSWICFLRGLEPGQQRWLWWSVGLYVLAVMSKENAVMVSGVSAALTIWWWRTQTNKPPVSHMVRRLRWVFVTCSMVIVLLALFSRGVLGSAYEPDAAEMLVVVVPEHAWPLSLITQGFLFFKYLGLWLLPNPMWMSVDMREPFAQAFLVWPQTIGFVAFLLWPLLSFWLLWMGGRRGLIGFAMISPWLLFATELTTVRIQEVFVLYRSYLWFAPVFSILLVLGASLGARLLTALVVAIPLTLFPLSLNRLTTFSHPLLLWDDAARLAEGKEGVKGVTGLERIYRNRGIHLSKVKKYELAIEDYTRAIGYKPNFYHAYNDRGAALLALRRYPEALADFEAALRLKPNYPNSTAGRATVLEAMGRINEARESYRVACTLGWRSTCGRLMN